MRRPLACLLVLSLFSCSTVKFNPARPIEEGFTQDGRKLDRDDLVATLSKLPESEALARQSRTLHIAGIALGFPGALFFAYEIVKAIDGNPNWPLFGAGAALWAGSMTLEILSQTALLDAAR